MNRKKVDRVIEYLEEAIHLAERRAVTEEELSERWRALGQAEAYRSARLMLMHHAAPAADLDASEAAEQARHQAARDSARGAREQGLY